MICDLRFTIGRHGCAAAAVVFMFLNCRTHAANQTTTEELHPIAQAVARLLETGDAKRFADAIAPTLKDWQAAHPTNCQPSPNDLGIIQNLVNHARPAVEASARNVLATAAALGVELSRAKLLVKDIPPRPLSRYQYRNLGGIPNPNLPAEEFLPWVSEIEIVLVGEPLPQATNASKLRGEFRLALGGVNGGVKYPHGWRFSDGIRWKSFPAGVADQKTQTDLAVLNAVISARCVTLADDPALAALGAVLVRFLREHDERILVTGALPGWPEVWEKFQKIAAKINEKLPPPGELEQKFGTMTEEFAGSARGVLAQATHLGLNLTNADIQLKDVLAGEAYARGDYGSVEGISCSQLRFVLDVCSPDTSKSGRPISGTYILTAAGASRESDRWMLGGKIRWQEFPKDLVGETELAELEFENYVAERGVLPLGTTAPEVEFTRLDNESKVKSADFRGKILVLEFWSTTCGPCQAPLAKLQTLRAEHPDWKDRVEIVTVSIDDKLKDAWPHLEKRGWTNTVSLWAGEGSWFAPPAKAFRLRGIPTAYVIDAEGRVAWAGHPFGNSIAQSVNKLLQPSAVIP